MSIKDVNFSSFSMHGLNPDTGLEINLFVTIKCKFYSSNDKFGLKVGNDVVKSPPDILLYDGKIGYRHKEYIRTLVLIY